MRLCPIAAPRAPVRPSQVLIPTTGPVDAAAIAAAAGLRLVAQPAAGYSNIDIDAARRAGVPVTTAPGFNRHSTAEAALMLMLMLARRIDEVRRGRGMCVCVRVCV